MYCTVTVHCVHCTVHLGLKSDMYIVRTSICAYSLASITVSYLCYGYGEIKCSPVLAGKRGATNI